MYDVIPENADVLIRIPNWIGDAVMSTSAINAIKTLRPDVNLYALAKPWVLDVVRNNPALTGVISYDPGHFPSRIHDFWSIVHALRKRSFHACILLHRNFESAVIGFSARIPVRIGWHDAKTAFFLSHTVKMTNDILNGHHVNHYLAIANYVTGNQSNGFKPVLYLTEEDKKSAADWLSSLNGDGPVIPIAAGAAYGSAKCWPPERFSRLIDQAITRWNAKIVFMGGEKDLQVCKIIQSGAKDRTFSMVGNYSLSVQAAVIEKAGICIANDSGLIHVSAALKGVRTVAIFGPTIPAATKPFGDRHIVLHRKTDCWPCKYRECPNGHECMTAISTEDVLDALETILGKR